MLKLLLFCMSSTSRYDLHFKQLDNLEGMQSSSITVRKLASHLIKEISINTFLFPILQSLFRQIIFSAALTEVTVRQK